MGADDSNDGPGECPGHDYSLEALLVVDGRLTKVMTCSRCGAPAV